MPLVVLCHLWMALPLGLTSFMEEPCISWTRSQFITCQAFWRKSVKKSGESQNVEHILRNNFFSVKFLKGSKRIWVSLVIRDLVSMGAVSKASPRDFDKYLFCIHRF